MKCIRYKRNVVIGYFLYHPEKLGYIRKKILSRTFSFLFVNDIISVNVK